ncbi:MAG: response regulator [Anaerolineae bacterium]|nr:response regulator [Anaerolineae bacterium]
MADPFALIIESDPAEASTFAGALQAAGFHTEVVGSGHKAQARLVFMLPDLVLLDMHLPYLPFWVVLRQIRAQERLENTQVVVAADDAQAASRLETAVEHVLLKPARFEQVYHLAGQLFPE